MVSEKPTKGAHQIHHAILRCCPHSCTERLVSQCNNSEVRDPSALHNRISKGPAVVSAVTVVRGSQSKPDKKIHSEQQLN